MPTEEELERLERTLAAADEDREADLVALEGVDTAALADYLSQPDPDTDGMEHD